jgi:Fic family protein
LAHFLRWKYFLIYLILECYNSLRRIIRLFSASFAEKKFALRRIDAIIQCMYIYQLPNWPHFSWNQHQISELLAEVRHKQGRLTGRMESIGFCLLEQTIVQTLTQDVVKSSEIEREILDFSQVRSSVARQLGIEHAACSLPDRKIDGMVKMILDATQNFDKPLTKERLFCWHRDLFPAWQDSFKKITLGAWRKGPVYVVSGQIGNEEIHFEAPPACLVDREMETFLEWINKKSSMDLVLKASIAHLWFVTIHPFDDGNGRIGRAIADFLLARSEKSARRFYSLSGQIQEERKHYYAILEQMQKGTLDVTSWIKWFLGCLERAIQKAFTVFETTLDKERFWKEVMHIALSERQRKMVNHLLDGFEGKLTSSKWAKMTKCSQDTAHRDILDLIEKKILIKNPEGGRSSSYSLMERKQSF